MSLNNVQSGSLNNVQGGSIGNVQGATLGGQKQEDKKLFEGNLFGNAADDLRTINATITTIAGGLIGTDKEARQALIDLFDQAARKPGGYLVAAGDAMLSTYDMTIEDLDKMPLGEVVGNVLSGAWKRPLTATLDAITLGKFAGSKIPKSLRKKMPQIQNNDVKIKLAEDLTKDNVRAANYGEQFVKQINDIEKKYNPTMIARGMEAIETVGFKKAPKELIPVMQDLTKANDTYKVFTRMSGAQLLDDYEFAAKELLSKRLNIPFKEMTFHPEFLKTKTFQDTLKYVKENDIRPLFHLKPKVFKDKSLPNLDDLIETDLLERAYGTIDYADASVKMTKKAQEFVDKVNQTQVATSVNRLNDKIRNYNKLNNTNIKEISTGNIFGNNRFLNELNSELKKVMLSSGIYLGANIVTTTLSILNNFDLNAAIKTAKNLPKFKLVDVGEAQTPILKQISKINNKIYRPIASVDKYVENVANEYIKNYGVDKAKFLQSTVPSKVVPTSNWQQVVKTLIPFGQYPIAAMNELGAHVSEKPLKTFFYNQVGKVGTQANELAQENNPNIDTVDPTKVIRSDGDKLITRSTVITPIQAANMFLFGEYGDAIQIPIIQFINKLVSGKGDPNVFEVNGKSYRIKDGKIKTQNGDIDIVPAITYAGRKLLAPVELYNKVIVPMLSNNYIADETKLVNTMVSDGQYANMSSQSQRRVVDKAREKVGKRLLGTYEYNYYDTSKVSKSVKRQIRYRIRQRNRLKRELSE